MSPRDKLYAAALALPREELVELVAALSETLEVPELTEEEEEGILLGLRQIDEGKTVPRDEFFREMRAIVASPPTPRRSRR